jgi:hypothetical protein
MRCMVGERHKIGFTLFVIAALLAGCSAAPGLTTATPVTPLGTSYPAVSATGTATVEPSLPAATPTPKRGGIQANPPKLPVGQIGKTLTAGWVTFTSPALGVALEHPKDWSVAENGAGVRFTSPQGVTIVLEGDQSRPTASPAGQDCSNVINSKGQAAETCYDAASSRYSALFKMPAGAPTAWVVLSTISKEKPVVYLQMFDSLRRLP